ncbi:MAG: glycoside hydrolase family 127 protein [Clostridia bacterium]|nr:glycoside hydrolase family 127 protein [Clostridia bacterium]
MKPAYSSPLPLRGVRVRDAFWTREMELVRTAVIPYQWEALNDRIPGAAPSYWMHNMRAAARALAARQAGVYQPRQKMTGMLIAPAPGEEPVEEGFYGWVFQDSDGYKWLEAVAYQLMIRPDPALQDQAQQAIDAICAAQEEDGYLDTYYTILGRDKAFSNWRDNHVLYCFGHLTEAAVAWRQATGRDDLLNAARRFGQCIARRFGPGKERGCPGHEIAEMALIRLYEETGEEQWLKMACFFLDVRGTEPSTFALEENRRRAEQGLPPLPVTAARYAYHQAHVPVRQMTEAVGHAVRQMYLCSGMADAARLTGDEAMAAACLRLWRSAVDEKMYVTGGVGGTHDGEAFSRPFDLPPDTAYSETCAAIGLVFFARRMLQLRPDSRFADGMELALYNTVLSGMALDGQSFFYVNPLEVDPAACETDRRLAHVKPVRQKWFGCACCPPNIARIVSSLPAYMLTRAADTLYVHLYIGSDIETELGGHSLRLRLEADLMRDGKIRLTVLAGSGEGRLAFRVPAWTDHPAFEAAGKEETEENGYHIFSGLWQPGDTVAIDLPMPVRALASSPLVKEAQDQLCFARGPFVYCAEETDNGNLLHLLYVTADAAKRARVETREIGGLALPCLTLPGKRAPAADHAPLYAPWQPAVKRDADIALIPYFAWSNRGKGEMRVWLRQEIYR